jgi:signal peptidase I
MKKSSTSQKSTFYGKSVLKELLSSSASLIAIGKKITKYRKRTLKSEVFSSIKLRILELERAIVAMDADSMCARCRALEKLLNEHGGDIYRKKFLNENVEAVFVAGLLAIAIRMFFIQSFQIPTNSMYPTYHGMTHRIVDASAANSSFFQAVWHKIKFGGSEVKILAESDGQVAIPLAKVMSGSGLDAKYAVPYEVIYGRKWFGLIKAKVRAYTFFVGGVEHRVVTPLEFSLDGVLLDKFYKNFASWDEVVEKNPSSVKWNRKIFLLNTGTHAKAGESVLHFEIFPGDVLFVDKIFHNFRPPPPGDSVVFKTDAIEAFSSLDSKFFIKRLVGVGGDMLKIRSEKLLINGIEPQDNEIFRKINGKTEGYENGYLPFGSMENECAVVVPNGKYFVLGDNSADSYDSRFWGFVPQKSVCGRPLVIFYPFARAGKCK